MDGEVALAGRYPTRKELARLAGIPGALTNQPPEGGTTDPAAGKSATGKPAEAQARTQQSTRNYELDRPVSHTQSSGGQGTPRPGAKPAGGNNNSDKKPMKVSL